MDTVLTTIAHRGVTSHAVSRTGRNGDKILGVTTFCNRYFETKMVELSEGPVETVDCVKCLNNWR